MASVARQDSRPSNYLRDWCWSMRESRICQDERTRETGEGGSWWGVTCVRRTYAICRQPGKMQHILPSLHQRLVSRQTSGSSTRCARRAQPASAAALKEKRGPFSGPARLLARQHRPSPHIARGNHLTSRPPSGQDISNALDMIRTCPLRMRPRLGLPFSRQGDGPAFHINSSCSSESPTRGGGERVRPPVDQGGGGHCPLLSCSLIAVEAG